MNKTEKKYAELFKSQKGFEPTEIAVTPVLVFVRHENAVYCVNKALLEMGHKPDCLFGLNTSFKDFEGVSGNDRAKEHFDFQKNYYR